MIAGLGFLGGVAAARFLKASSERRYEGYDGRRRFPEVTGTGYVGTSAYGPSYRAPGAFDDGTAPLGRDPAAVDPLADRPLGPEG
jgi:hypothetical protein